MSKIQTSYRFDEVRDDDYDDIVVGWQRIRTTIEVLEFIDRPDPETAAEFAAARKADPHYSDEAYHEQERRREIERHQLQGGRTP